MNIGNWPIQHEISYSYFIYQVVVALAFVFNSQVQAAPGDLDPAFGTSGIIMTALEGSAEAQDIVVQSDGKILVAGSMLTTNNNIYFVLVRYNADGFLDTTFSDDGIVVTPINGTYDYGESVAVQSDGKILVAGDSFNASSFAYEFALARYNTNGTLDTSFSGDGLVTTPIDGKWGGGRSVAVQDDGKILVTGYSGINGTNHIVLMRYNMNGSLDTSFSGDGIVNTYIGTSAAGQEVVVQSDGKILVAGYAHKNINDSDFALVRFNTDGTLDASFSDDGLVTTSIGTAHDYGRSLAVQSDGKILVAGRYYIGNDYYFALVRYNTNGTMDTSFSDDGIFATDFDDTKMAWGKSIAIHSDGRILMAGRSFNGSNDDFALVRINTNGTLDTSFSIDGKVTTSIGNSSDWAEGIAVQSDGNIILAGRYWYEGSGFGIALARYMGDPAIDVHIRCVDDSIIGPTIVIEWPTELTDAILEAAPDLASPWTSVTSDIIAVGQNYEYHLSYSNALPHQYFRLGRDK